MYISKVIIFAVTKRYPIHNNQENPSLNQIAKRMHMLKLLTTRNFLILTLVSFSFMSCKNGSIFSKKKAKSDATGWNYDDKNYGNFHVLKAKEQKAGPGLIFVQGGTFTMGAKEEDVMGDWNNIPRRVTVNSFYIDETEVANVHYREYLYWLVNTFDNDTVVMNRALPDTLVWRSELAFNEPYVLFQVSCI
jgi:sulfatase modifying factor 1